MLSTLNPTNLGAEESRKKKYQVAFASDLLEFSSAVTHSVSAQVGSVWIYTVHIKLSYCEYNYPRYTATYAPITVNFRGVSVVKSSGRDRGRGRDGGGGHEGKRDDSRQQSKLM